jgi:mannose-6-phosphate isomerase-like protein (cupin superfamily)
MTVRTWTTDGDSPRTVRIEHWSVFSGRARITIDGKEIYLRKRSLYDIGFEHRFKLDGLPAIIRCLFRTWHYEYELWIDGKLQ